MIKNINLEQEKRQKKIESLRIIKCIKYYMKNENIFNK
jgi:hypothetical protein